jgi:hypothetical protein
MNHALALTANLKTSTKQIPPALLGLTFDLKTWEQADLYWSDDGEATSALIAASLRVNRHHIPKTGFRLLFINGALGSGRTTTVRQLLSSLPGPLIYFELTEGNLTEPVVASFELFLPKSPPVAILISGLDQTLEGWVALPEEQTRRALLVRLAAAIESAPNATLILETLGGKVALQENGLSKVYISLDPPKPTEEIVAAFLVKNLAPLLTAKTEISYGDLANELVCLDKDWQAIKNDLRQIVGARRLEKHPPPLDTPLLAHYFNFGPYRQPKKIEASVLRASAMHEAAHVLLSILVFGPTAVEFVLLAQDLSSADQLSLVEGYVSHSAATELNYAVNNEIISAAGRICEEIILGAARGGCNGDLAEMRGSILSRIAATVTQVTEDSALTPAEMDRWLPTQIIALMARIEAGIYRAAREVILVNRQGLERFANVLVHERFLSGKKLEAALQEAAFINLYGASLGPDSSWSLPDFAVYHLDLEDFLSDGLEKEIDRLAASQKN